MRAAQTLLSPLFPPCKLHHEISNSPLCERERMSWGIKPLHFQGISSLSSVCFGAGRSSLLLPSVSPLSAIAGHGNETIGQVRDAEPRGPVVVAKIYDDDEPFLSSAANNVVLFDFIPEKDEDEDQQLHHSPLPRGGEGNSFADAESPTAPTLHLHRRHDPPQPAKARLQTSDGDLEAGLRSIRGRDGWVLRSRSVMLRISGEAMVINSRAKS